MYRHEMKYVITPVQAELIKMQIGTMCLLDEHVNSNNKYQIKSIYFDTISNKYYNETLDGVNKRHKYRVRKYNEDNSSFKLERKSTENGLKCKEAISISLSEVVQLLNNDLSFLIQREKGVASAFVNDAMLYLLRPVVVVTYERTPFVYQIGNVRITFDEHIRATNDVASFFSGYSGLEQEICQGSVVLEVKYDELLPKEIIRILNVNGVMSQSAFSKYANSINMLSSKY